MGEMNMTQPWHDPEYLKEAEKINTFQMFKQMKELIAENESLKDAAKDSVKIINGWADGYKALEEKLCECEEVALVNQGHYQELEEKLRLSEAVIENLRGTKSAMSDVIEYKSGRIIELEEKLRLANEIIDELVEVAEVHLDDTFEKIAKIKAP